jgi:hypothetical protein
MLPDHSIKSLYPLALAEGEGIGTAYEYYAKRRVLARWLVRFDRPRSMLIAGLPEKYGCSLDFFLIAQDLSAAKVVVVDDRPQALEKMRQSLHKAQCAGGLRGVHPEYIRVATMTGLEELSGDFDLCLGSEVLQRMRNDRRHDYIERLCGLASAIALFAPNGDNRNHTTLSGLSGIALSDLEALAKPAGSLFEAGYVDMPPFPPGLTRSADQRKRAAAGRLEGLTMAGLGYYACLESCFPSAWRRNHSHIVYGFIEQKTL